MQYREWCYVIKNQNAIDHHKLWIDRSQTMSNMPRSNPGESTNRASASRLQRRDVASQREERVDTTSSSETASESDDQSSREHSNETSEGRENIAKLAAENERLRGKYPLTLCRRSETAN